MNPQYDEMEVEDAAVVVSSSGASVNTKNGLPWVEKYRPSSLQELIAHEDIINILNQLIETNKLPHLLFYGPPGTGNLATSKEQCHLTDRSFHHLGKTSTIIACAKKMYGESYNSMILELNASDDRGIDVVREQIKVFAGTKKLWR